MKLLLDTHVLINDILCLPAGKFLTRLHPDSPLETALEEKGEKEDRLKALG
jgi:hypothetical protein